MAIGQHNWEKLCIIIKVASVVVGVAGLVVGVVQLVLLSSFWAAPSGIGLLGEESVFPEAMSDFWLFQCTAFAECIPDYGSE